MAGWQDRFMNDDVMTSRRLNSKFQKTPHHDARANGSMSNGSDQCRIAVRSWTKVPHDHTVGKKNSISIILYLFMIMMVDFYRKIDEVN